MSPRLALEWPLGWGVNRATVRGAVVVRKVRQLRAQEGGVNRIARELGIGSGTVRRITRFD